ncbi:MAG: excinuclease ABC subunit UvrA [Bacteroidota bacterium]|nr:excinuclease ABC subunit UvrA [Bacteroidota bacterium]MDP4231767.1 excinuclease ABC subunit UvrA [Bacteroidota bacterium]MDP4243503.1 excinuclease ABC subunit UvrA [Bacteroidota bacterium]MDP4287104.1 excinuclease ABC subunit UvrA [Bacteroidota bacterium]
MAKTVRTSRSKVLPASGKKAIVPQNGTSTALNPQLAAPNKLPSAKRPISVKGARLHNLKNLSLDLERNKIHVFTGVSGSGKSSLAFDTLYAEGQRRYVESLSVYARQFLERMQKPDVDSITGISPAVAIEQKTTTRNPRSTVATQTEIYDYLRLLFARVGKTYCIRCGRLVRKDTTQSIVESIRQHIREGQKFYVLFPMHQHEDHTLNEEWDNLRQQGYFRIVLQGEARVLDLSEENPKQIDPSTVRILIDRLIWRAEDDGLPSRIADSIETAFRESSGRVIIAYMDGDASTHEELYSELFECANDGLAYEEPEPRLFSFNNPYGACPECQGFGRAIGIDADLVVPDRTRSIRGGAIVCWSGPKFSEYNRELIAIAKEAGVRTDVPYNSLTDHEREVVWSGHGAFVGVNGFFTELERQTYKLHYRVMLSRFRGYTVCPKCHGSRLRPAAMNVRVADKTIHDIVRMTTREARRFFEELVLPEYEQTIAVRILDELRKRTRYLDEVGLSYLTLDRLSNTLSGGESQRINLATSLGGALVGALYVLDEPTIGLHQRDTAKLLAILHRVRDLGNTVIVVEHDEEVILAADQVVDFGPLAGELGGEILFQGSVAGLLADKKGRSLTGKYLRREREIAVPIKRRRTDPRYVIRVTGASEHNLKDLTVSFPLESFVVVTGVSGSGKSTLVHSVLYSALKKLKGESVGAVGSHHEIEGADHVRHVELVDQTPIGRTPRSNPATYVKVFDLIREAFSRTVYAKQRGWAPGYFSFNIPGGRCEACQGEGYVKVEMQFLADMYLLCDSCGGKRYKQEVLDATLDGKNIVDVLGMTVSEAVTFFEEHDRIRRRLQVLDDVGLGYMRLGQPATTLSGGEAQRVKLAAHLADEAEEHTLFIFDEPTTGLHFDDIAKLLAALNALVERGHSVIAIEHNLDVIKTADWVIDLGPDAGSDGGEIVAEGTPEVIAKEARSYTGKYLAPLLK